MTKTCRKCGTAFSDNLKTCPVCKTAIILDKEEQPVSNVTASYAALRDQLELVSLKSRIVTSILFFFIGFLGLGWYYLGFKVRALLHISLVGFTFIVMFLLFPNQVFYGFLAWFILQTVMSLYYLFNPDAKDARGELLK
jgi:hypothetical protein